jgi:hypothetical protein
MDCVTKGAKSPGRLGGLTRIALAVSVLALAAVPLAESRAEVSEQLSLSEAQGDSLLAHNLYASCVTNWPSLRPGFTMAMEEHARRNNDYVDQMHEVATGKAELLGGQAAVTDLERTLNAQRITQAYSRRTYANDLSKAACQRWMFAMRQGLVDYQLLHKKRGENYFGPPQPFPDSYDDRRTEPAR